ncbi:MAG: GNAT family N-acetyltransferase [Thermococci archaeon]|nr:GNAT family N-acetyltransferase [Thermococci archaeon]
MRPVILRGKAVSLGVLTRDDLRRLWEWYNDRSIQLFLQRPWEVLTYEDEVEWYERVRRNSERERVFGIIENPTQDLVGVIGLSKIDPWDGHAEVGYYLSKEHWGQGYAREALSLIITYAFDWMNLRKLYANVYEPNEASIRVLEANGFRLAGRFRRHHHVPGTGYVDMLVYELLRDE